MNTQIEYLEELREDLLSAAWEEADRAPSRRRFRRPRRFSRGNLVAACLALFLVASGGVGWFVLGGGPYDRPLIEALSSGKRPTNDAASQHEFANQSGDLAQVAPSTRQSSHDSAYTTTTGAGTAPAPAAAAGAGGGGATAGAEGTSSGRNPSPGSPDGSETSAPSGDFTRIIKTAEVGLVVPTGGSLKDRFDTARAVAHRYSGFVTKSSIQPGKTEQMEIRVPARNFDAAITALEKLGSLEHESIKGQDVTAQFVDLQARLSIAQTHRDVLEKLLAKAHSPEQIVRMQNLVDDAQLKVEQLQGEIRLIKNQTSKATIDLSLRMAGVAVPTRGAVDHPGLGSAWAHAIAGFFGVVFAVVVGLGYLVPIAVVLLIVWLVYRRLRRRSSPAFVDD